MAIFVAGTEVAVQRSIYVNFPESIGSRGRRPSILLDYGQYACTGFSAPSDLSSVTTAYLFCEPDATSTVYDIVVYTYASANGEDTTLNGDSFAFYGTVTTDKINRVTITDAFSHVSGGDHVGINVTNDESSKDLYIYGIEINY